MKDADPARGHKLEYGCVLFVLIILGVLAIPMFNKFFSDKQKPVDKEKTAQEQPESLQILEALHAAQSEYFAEHGTYSASFGDLGWKPEGDSVYALFLPEDSVQPEDSGSVQLPGGLKAFASETGFTAIAAGNIDDDPVLDVWWINDSKGVRHVVDDSSF
ncbi:MAG: hypothetical protein R6V10_07490 [bacterium]